MRATAELPLPRVGLPADELLKMAGYDKVRIQGRTRLLGRDGGGLVLEWTYPNCAVELRWRRGYYRVAAVRDAPSEGGILVGSIQDASALMAAGLVPFRKGAEDEAANRGA